MDKNGNTFTVVFAVATCVVLATCLAATFNGLKPRMDKNALFDKQKNVLIAVGLVNKQDADSKPQAELEQLFRDKVEVTILKFNKSEVDEPYMESGERKTRRVRRVTEVVPVEGKTIRDLPVLQREVRQKKLSNDYTYGELYVAQTEGGKTYCLPISGYGLWSTLYGFLALKSDLDHVQGLTFYKHGETPGLGGEVENPKWQAQWRDGRRILKDGRLLSITVKKGRVDPSNDQEKIYMVDGLSGATITCDGVTRFVRADLERYELYFAKLRQKQQ